ncbi:hypothetical protein, partial [Pseudoalteromonas sp. SG41-5]|uniref:hypothetical protein n=1 Tax=Pseudoalteromonas sp. SG41-5 TaxID=2760975 RepID=UPI002175DE7E
MVLHESFLTQLGCYLARQNGSIFNKMGIDAGKDLCLETEQNNVQFVIKNNQFIDVKNELKQQTNNGNINYQSAGN